MSTRVFRESQHFRQPWLWLLLLGIDAVIIYGIIAELVFNSPLGDNPASIGTMLVILFFMAAFTLLFVIMRLDTEIQHDGIYYRFYPFHRKLRGLSKSTISEAYIRKYNPILEFGGWGIRIGWVGKGMAFNVSGNMGLQIEYSRGKKLLIGTKKPKEVEQALKDLGYSDR